MMSVSFADLMQFALVIIGLISLCHELFKDK